MTIRKEHTFKIVHLSNIRFVLSFSIGKFWNFEWEELGTLCDYLIYDLWERTNYF